LHKDSKVTSYKVVTTLLPSPFQAFKIQSFGNLRFGGSPPGGGHFLRTPQTKFRKSSGPSEPITARVAHLGLDPVGRDLSFLWGHTKVTRSSCSSLPLCAPQEGKVTRSSCSLLPFCVPTRREGNKEQLLLVTFLCPHNKER